MTNEEMRRWLECALDWLQRIKLDADSEQGIALGSGVCAIETALDGLQRESEPLAVVEGWAMANTINPNSYQLPTIWKERPAQDFLGFIPVTVTITIR